MNIGNIAVITPYDTPVDYQPDWRHCVSTAMADLIGIADLDTDDADIIIRHMRFMKCNRLDNDRSKLPADYKDHRITFDWYNDDGIANSIKHYLEALLLTSKSYKEIATDLGVTWQQVRLYEQLFYNIRDDNGEDTKAKILKLRFANSRNNQADGFGRYVDWKRAAVSLGYNILLAIWGWETSEENDLAIQRILVSGTRGTTAMRIIRGEINNFDINGLISNYNDRIRIAHEHQEAEDLNKLSTGAGSPLKSAWYVLLQDLSPKMVASVTTNEEMSLNSAGLRNKLQAQHNIDKVEVEDKRPQAIADFSATLKKQLTEG